MSRLFLRVETISGPRTVVSHELSTRDASEIANALSAAGFEAVVNDDVVSVPMATLVKRKKRLAGIEAKRTSAISANVMKMVKRGRT